MPACRWRTSSNAAPTSRSCSTRVHPDGAARAGSARGWPRSRPSCSGLFHQRGEALGGRVAATGRGAAAEIADFLMLQAINRYEPLLAHYADAGALHPEEFFQLCVAAAGELATFTTHVEAAADVSRLSARSPARVVRAGHRVAPRRRSAPCWSRARSRFRSSPRSSGSASRSCADRSLYSTAVFILAARADIAGRRAAPAVSGAAQDRPGREDPRPGHAAAARRAGACRAGGPRQIPFHAGYAYFELDQSNELWDQLKTSGGVAMHVAGEFPGLAMEFWAIRS